METIIAIFRNSRKFPNLYRRESNENSESNSNEYTQVARMKRIEKQIPEYDLFITDLRLICGVVWCGETDMPQGTIGYETPALQEYIRKKRERRSQFEGKSPEEILAMHPLSLSIEYGEIDSVEAHLGFFNARIEIITNSFDIKNPLKIPIDRERHEEAQLILRSIFDDNAL